MATRTWKGTTDDWNTTSNWYESAVPITGDKVYIPAGSGAIGSNLNQSAVSLAAFEIEEGYSNNIGDKTAYLQVGISNDAVLAPSGGAQFLDFGSSAKGVDIRKTGSAATGLRAVNIIGSALTTISVQSGSVGLAIDPAKTATVGTVRAYGGNVWVGQGVTLTTVNNLGANITVDCAATTITQLSGTIETRYSGAVTTVNLYDGTYYPSSSGTVTTLNAYGGTVDSRRSGIARTITTLNAYGNKPVRLYIDPAAVTVGTFNRPSVLYTSSFQVGA